MTSPRTTSTTPATAKITAAIHRRVVMPDQYPPNDYDNRSATEACDCVIGYVEELTDIGGGVVIPRLYLCPRCFGTGRAQASDTDGRRPR